MLDPPETSPFDFDVCLSEPAGTGDSLSARYYERAYLLHDALAMEAPPLNRAGLVVALAQPSGRRFPERQSVNTPSEGGPSIDSEQ